MSEHDQDIDHVVTVILDLLAIGVKAYPPLAVAVPVISLFVKYQAAQLKTGIADGSIVPDRRGGWVPTTNSRVDPKTGEFL